MTQYAVFLPQRELQLDPIARAVRHLGAQRLIVAVPFPGRALYAIQAHKDGSDAELAEQLLHLLGKAGQFLVAIETTESGGRTLRLADTEGDVVDEADKELLDQLAAQLELAPGKLREAVTAPESFPDVARLQLDPLPDTATLTAEQTRLKKAMGADPKPVRFDRAAVMGDEPEEAAPAPEPEEEEKEPAAPTTPDEARARAEASTTRALIVIGGAMALLLLVVLLAAIFGKKG